MFWSWIFEHMWKVRPKNWSPWMGRNLRSQQARQLQTLCSVSFTFSCSILTHEPHELLRAWRSPMDFFHYIRAIEKIRCGYQWWIFRISKIGMLNHISPYFTILNWDLTIFNQQFSCVFSWNLNEIRWDNPSHYRLLGWWLWWWPVMALGLPVYHIWSIKKLIQTAIGQTLSGKTSGEFVDHP